MPSTLGLWHVRFGSATNRADLIVTDTVKANFLRKAFGKQHEIDSDASNWTFACPNRKCGSHAKEKLKFVVRIEDSMCHCWVCDLKGRTIGWVLKKHRPELVEEFEQLWSVSGYAAGDETDEPEEPPYELPEDFQLLGELVESGGIRNPDHVAVMQYLQNRGVTLDDLWRYKIGVSSENGYRRSALFPSFDADGNCRFCLARRATDELKFKYKNHGAKAREVVYDEIHLRTDERIHVFEGVFDLIRSRVNGTALMGSFLSEGSALFKKLAQSAAPVTLCLDEDATDKAISIAAKLSRFGIDVRIARLPSGADPGSMERDDVLAALDAAQPFRWQDGLLNRIKGIRSGSVL